MEKKHNVPNGFPVRRRLGAAALVVLSLIAVTGAEARTARKDDFNAFTFGGGARGPIGFGSDGTPLATSSKGGPTSGNMSWKHDTTGKPYATGDFAVPMPGGRSGSASGRVPLSQFGGAIFRSGMRGMAAGGLWGAAALSAWELAQQMGYMRGTDPETGQPALGEMVTNVPYCSYYNSPSQTRCPVASGGSGWAMGFVASAELLREWAYQSGGLCGNGTRPAVTVESVSASGGVLRFGACPGGTSYTQNFGHVTRPGVQSFDAVTEAEFAERVDNMPSWAPTSAVDAAIAEAVNAGEAVETAPTPAPAGSGLVDDLSAVSYCADQTRDGSVTVTTNPDGSTTTRTQQWKLTCTGGVIDIGEKVTTTTKDAAGNPTGTTTTETKNPTLPATPSTSTPTTTSTQPDPCIANPTRVGCMVVGDVPTDAIPKVTKSVTYAEENLGFGSGQCPAPFTWTDSLGSHSISLASYCNMVTTVVKPLVLAFAALTCLFILMPGRLE